MKRLKKWDLKIKPPIITCLMIWGLSKNIKLVKINGGSNTHDKYKQ